MPRTLPTPTRTRVRAGSLRDTLGIAWEENADRLVDTGTFFGGVCHVPHDLFDTCADDLNKTGTSGEGSVEVPVFGFYESGTCTTAADPSVIERLMTDVAQKAANSQSFNVERGLWNGRADSVPAADTWFLASSGAADPNGGVATGIVPGLADMVAALDAALGGERGIVHVPHFLVPFLQFYGQIDRQGNVLSLNHTDHLDCGRHRIRRVRPGRERDRRGAVDLRDRPGRSRSLPHHQPLLRGLGDEHAHRLLGELRRRIFLALRPHRNPGLYPRPGP